MKNRATPPANAGPTTPGAGSDLPQVDFHLRTARALLRREGERTGDRKLIAAARILLVVSLGIKSSSPKALDGLEHRTRKYVGRRLAAPTMLPTLQDAAKGEMRDRLTEMRGAATRAQVASYLARALSRALRLYELVRPTSLEQMHDELAVAIERRMPRTKTLARVDGAVVATTAYEEDPELTIVAAAKTAGVRPGKADQLFKARR